MVSPVDTLESLPIYRSFGIVPSDSGTARRESTFELRAGSGSDSESVLHLAIHRCRNMACPDATDFLAFRVRRMVGINGVEEV